MGKNAERGGHAGLSGVVSCVIDSQMPRVAGVESPGRGLSPVSELPPTCLTCIGARVLKDLSMVLRRATLIPEPYALASTYSNVIPKA